MYRNHGTKSLSTMPVAESDAIQRCNAVSLAMVATVHVGELPRKKTESFTAWESEFCAARGEKM